MTSQAILGIILCRGLSPEFQVMLMEQPQINIMAQLFEVCFALYCIGL